MRRRWLDPGSGRWLTITLWVLVGLLAGYFVFRLGSALARRFGAIRRSYEIPGAFYPGSGESHGARLPDPLPVRRPAGDSGARSQPRDTPRA